MSEQEKKYTIISPQREKDASYFIDAKFYREVVLHYVKNNLQMLNPPLILCVQGKAGEGKTSHIIHICDQMNVSIFLIHGSALFGNLEGEPVKIINEVYVKASNYSIEHPVIILVDDIDTSVASIDEDRRYTVNSQLINGFFMNIANDPGMGNVQTKRIPIIFTGNNLSNLYAPLRRTGRIRLYSWEPGPDVKTHIIEHIYKDVINEEERTGFLKMIQRHIDQPISFFVDLKNNLLDDVIMDEILKQKKVNFQNLDSLISSTFAQYNWLPKLKVEIQELANNTIQDYNK